MDRDVALTIHSKMLNINTSLQRIVNGIENSATSDNRSLPENDEKSIQADEPENVSDKK